MKDRTLFLPVTAKDLRDRSLDSVDFVYVTGDAYVDHPSFGVAIISRVLTAAGFTVALLSQPDYKSTKDFERFGRPRLGFLVSSGNIDSMVAHYTVSKKRRSYDYYSPGGKMGARPDRAVIVYSNRIREAYGDIPIIIGGLEASLRRFAHYDYWDDKVRRSILVDSRADLISYGMGERSILRIAELLDRGIPVRKIRDVRGTVYLAPRGDKIHFPFVETEDYDVLKTDKEAYARSFATQYRNNDSVRGRAVVEYYGEKMVVANPPAPPLEREELDQVYSLPFTREYHPDYEPLGGVPAISEVRFSITHNRGCFGACNFCAIAFHQGREVRSRSEESVLREAREIAALPDFKGYINDVGGPTANFRYPSCDKQKKDGVCPNRKCLAPTPCKNLKVDHTEYAHLLSEIEKIDRVKRVFVRSGIRFDYLMYDGDDSFFDQLVTHHVSGQLKVAPEHCSDNALRMMGKPPIAVFEAFRKKYFAVCQAAGLEQYLVPYLMSSHPGTTMTDAVNMAIWLKRWGYMPEQVQDFYPTPGTVSTVMYYTGLDPMTMKRVPVTTDYREKQLQRALLQFSKPENRNLVREALTLAGREDLIGYGEDCLVRPAFGRGEHHAAVGKHRSGGKNTAQGSKGSAPKSGAKALHSAARAGKNANKSLPKVGAADKKRTASGISGEPRRTKSAKIDRVFGADASRIRREADRLASSGGASPKKSSKKR